MDGNGKGPLGFGWPHLAQIVLFGGAVVAGWVSLSNRLAHLDDEFAKVRARQTDNEATIKRQGEDIAYLRGLVLLFTREPQVPGGLPPDDRQ
jgi:hypothetical protein